MHDVHQCPTGGNEEVAQARPWGSGQTRLPSQVGMSGLGMQLLQVQRDGQRARVGAKHAMSLLGRGAGDGGRDSVAVAAEHPDRPR